jgi:hypothetical protein
MAMTMTKGINGSQECRDASQSLQSVIQTASAVAVTTSIALDREVENYVNEQIVSTRRVSVFGTTQQPKLSNKGD